MIRKSRACLDSPEDRSRFCSCSSFSAVVDAGIRGNDFVAKL